MIDDEAWNDLMADGMTVENGVGRSCCRRRKDLEEVGQKVGWFSFGSRVKGRALAREEQGEGDGKRGTPFAEGAVWRCPGLKTDS